MFTYDDVKAMTKPIEFAKQFKKMMHWRKAKGIVILADYKMGTKKMTIAIPYKKSNDAKKEFKRTIKGDNFPGLPPKRKIFVGQMKIEKQADGTEKVIVKQIEGGASMELINEKAGGLFEKIKVGFQVHDPNAPQTTEAPETTTEAPTAPTSQPTDSTENTTVDIRALAQAAKTAMQLIKNELVPAFRAGTITATNTPQLNDSKTKLVDFKTAYDGATANVKAQLERLYQPLERMLVALDKMLEQANNSSSTTENATPTETSSVSSTDLANMIRNIKTAMQEVKATAVANLRAQNATEDDLKMVAAVIAQINEFNTKYAQAADAVQQQLARHKEKIQTMLTQLQSVETKIKDALQTTTETSSNTAKIQQTQERVEQIRNRIQEIREALAA
ncbi:MAG: hypothetical protein GY810_01590 [Aureispira sp.]|nr:hypothetical protein [Aureispira sp.]